MFGTYLSSFITFFQISLPIIAPPKKLAISRFAKATVFHHIHEVHNKREVLSSLNKVYIIKENLSSGKSTTFA